MLRSSLWSHTFYFYKKSWIELVLNFFGYSNLTDMPICVIISIADGQELQENYREEQIMRLRITGEHT
jgi:hypothetical protein